MKEVFFSSFCCAAETLGALFICKHQFVFFYMLTSNVGFSCWISDNETILAAVLGVFLSAFVVILTAMAAIIFRLKRWDYTLYATGAKYSVILKVFE